MPTFPPSLTNEQGSSATFNGEGTPESWEENGELRWPYSLTVYDRMRRTEGKLAAVRRAIDLPVRETRWSVAGEDVDDRVAAFVEAELGLQPDETGRARRRRQGISWDDFLRHALLHLYFGHMAFEQVYEVGAPPPGITGLPPAVLHLRKLAPRMPRSISRWDVAPDGGLLGIVQSLSVPVGTPPYNQFRQVSQPIPVERLVVFVNEMEGSDWVGNSILRAAYRNFIMKDRLERIAAMVVERNGMGVPKVSHPPSADRRHAERIAANLRAGEYSGVTIPDDWDVELMGVTGGTVDPLPLIKYHDEAMARSALAMFLDLGHDNGARSLGDTFVDVFTKSLNAVVRYIEETVTEHVIRDLVALNFGADEPYPALRGEDIQSVSTLTPEQLATLANDGVVTADRPLEDAVRRQYGLPEADVAAPPAPVGGGLPALPAGPPPPVELPPAAVRASGALADLDARIAALQREIAARR